MANAGWIWKDVWQKANSDDVKVSTEIKHNKVLQTPFRTTSKVSLKKVLCAGNTASPGASCLLFTLFNYHPAVVLSLYDENTFNL